MNPEIKIIIEQYQDGARKIAQDLHDWNIASSEALFHEKEARTMWYEDAAKLGVSRDEACEIWQKEIVDAILLLTGEEAWETLAR